MKRFLTPAIFLIIFSLASCFTDADAQKRAAKKQSSVPTESSVEMKKRQKATQQEIRETKRQIATNEKSISKGVADLGRIDADIKVTQKKVSDLAGQMHTLDNRISSLTSQIAANERELKELRDNYLVSVKKIRKSKGNSSSLSFIFSSKNFGQAMRRIRYLRQFNAWRDRQTKIIRQKNMELKRQNDLLAQAKSDKNRALGQQKQAQATLRNQYARQDALVAELRVQGDRLRNHLAKKQAEANSLKNSIAAVIAAEQERERQRQAEQQRIAEQKRLEAQRVEAERKARAEAEAQRKAREKQDMTASNTLKAPSKEAKTKKPTKEKKKPVKEKTKPAKEEKRENVKKNDGNRTYADARRREVRGKRKADSDAASKSSTPASAPAEAKASAPVRQTPAAAGFEKSRGSLPKPVNGAFRIVSHFGRHPLPELPDVVYDNPGIDAEVSAGASAQAVYAGRVSGIYRLPGYNTVVIVSHGDYYTVYGNLETTNVKTGQSVKQYQAIGKVANSDDSGRPSIHFEVWKNRDKLNPAEWIR